jgi:hypothetical protein
MANPQNASIISTILGHKDYKLVVLFETIQDGRVYDLYVKLEKHSKLTLKFEKTS